ncbi:NAD(P)-binding protein [Flagelloscypha sp. PMI_526]|nr:NAD(P)-binding protein [Flagelloscypha sp. PMI_526]
MSSALENVLIVGATGYTGKQIVKALVQTKRFNISALVRFSSLSKPTVEEFRSLGVTILSGDIATDSSETLEKHLSGTDILISSVQVMIDQRPLLLAAKKANVKRVVPSDFGPHINPGIMTVQDMKLAVRAFVKEHEIPHTFTEVGLWVHNMYPLPHSMDSIMIPGFGKEMYGTGKVLVSWTDYSNIGKLIALIVADPRTRNQVVHAYDGEATLEETWAAATKASGEDFSDYTKVTAEVVEKKRKIDMLHEAIFGYYSALYIHGENTVEKAVADGVLDSHKLYPDYSPMSLEESVRKFYAAPYVFMYEL